ncbi:hypothetical protein NKI79_18860 [Mesorhizobium sp. M0340]|uniref:hypothetical protein n=1 Tax=Mesorhizobium sp. M0340 TaxID=2956939 RepID=UPI003339820E
MLEKLEHARASARPEIDYEIDYEKVKSLVEYQCKRFRVKPDKFFPLKGKTKVTITSRLVGDHMIHIDVDFYECAVIERVGNQVREGLEALWGNRTSE